MFDVESEIKKKENNSTLENINKNSTIPINWLLLNLVNMPSRHKHSYTRGQLLSRTGSCPVGGRGGGGEGLY